MPLYFFHLHNDIDVSDNEGQELPDLEAARAYATKQVRALIGESARTNGRIILNHRLDIEDQAHNIVATVRYADVLTIEN